MARANTNLAKWGTSLAVRIPRRLLEAAQWKAGEELELEVRDRTLVIQPAAHKPTLDELLAGITPDNCHPATDWGSPAGNEEW